jgi:hypothetical protein
MISSSIKPRWQTWENLCLIHAFKQKIQLKVIGAALNKSLHAVSKKIKRLGLREEKHRPGRPKGYKCGFLRTHRLRALEKRKDVITAYAPLSYTHVMKVAPKVGYWTIGKPPPFACLKRGKCVGQLKQDNVPYSLVFPLNQILSHEKNLREVFMLKGISYWKQGENLPKEQALFIINKARRERNLQPLRLQKATSEP